MLQSLFFRNENKHVCIETKMILYKISIILVGRVSSGIVTRQLI